MIKSFWNKLCKLGFLYLLGFVFCAIVPIIMLTEMVINSQAELGIKISFGFCLIAVVCFFVMRNQLKKLAEKVKNEVLRELAMTTLLALWWGFGIVVILGVSAAIDKIEAFWWRLGICFLVGSCFYILHAATKQRRLKRDGK